MKPPLKTAFMEVAHVFAKLSKAERLKVGAIAVKNGRILSIGYNGTPSGFDNKCEDENGKTKIEVLHAEANCLAKLAKCTESSDGCAIFVTHSPCVECAKQMFVAGVKEVYYDKEYRDATGIALLQKFGVKVEHWSWNGE
jgi:dCMP deaminase